METLQWISAIRVGAHATPWYIMTITRPRRVHCQTSLIVATESLFWSLYSFWGVEWIQSSRDNVRFPLGILLYIWIPRWRLDTVRARIPLLRVLVWIWLRLRIRRLIVINVMWSFGFGIYFGDWPIHFLRQSVVFEWLVHPLLIAIGLVAMRQLHG